MYSSLVYPHCLGLGTELHIGYTMKPRRLRDLEPRGNQYSHPLLRLMKSKEAVLLDVELGCLEHGI